MTRMRGAQRMTRQRHQLLDALGDGDKFVSAQDLYETMLRAGERVSLATVYRFLQTMADGGELDTIQSEGETLYRRCEDPAHHHHLVCRECGATEEIEDHGVEEWITKVAAKHKFADVDHTVELIGVCAKCASTTGSRRRR